MTEQRRTDNENQTQGQSTTESRFDRRRFLRASAIATPLMMTVKSPMAWGTETCTASVYASGNTSHAHNCTLVAPLTSQFWQGIVQGQSVTTTSSFRSSGENNAALSMQTLFRNLLLNAGYDENTRFDQVFLKDYEVTQRRSKISGNGNWKFKLRNSTNQPNFNDAIVDGNYPVQFKFWDSNNNANKCIVDFSFGATGHREVLTAFLNGLFSGSMIDYPHSGTDVINAFRNAIDTMIDSVIASCDASPRDISGCTFTQNEWQSLVETTVPTGLRAW